MNNDVNLWLVIAVIFGIGFVEIHYLQVSSVCESKGGVLVSKIPFGTACVQHIR